MTQSMHAWAAAERELCKEAFAYWRDLTYVKPW